MPSTSVFCPHCGKAVDNAVSVASQEHAPARQPQQPTYNEQRRAAERQAARQPMNAWKQPEPVEEEDDDDNDGGGGSNFNRNLIIGIVAARE